MRGYTRDYGEIRIFFVNICAARQPDKWFHPLVKDESRSARMFLLPYAGASNYAYKQLAPSLNDRLEIFSLTLPGRPPRLSERPYVRMSPLIESIAASFEQWLDKPFFFFGHSMGSIITYELSLYLNEVYGVWPERLFVSAHRAPHLPSRHPPLHTLSDSDLIAELGKLDGTPEEALQNKELMEFLLAQIRADTELIETYEFAGGRQVGCAITAFFGRNDDWILREELHAWSRYTDRGFHCYELPGNHFYFRDYSRQLGEAIALDLDAT